MFRHIKYVSEPFIFIEQVSLVPRNFVNQYHTTMQVRELTGFHDRSSENMLKQDMVVILSHSVLNNI
jgi:hypothetical protein